MDRPVSSALRRRYDVLCILAAAESAGFFDGAAHPLEVRRLAHELLGAEYADMKLTAYLAQRPMEVARCLGESDAQYAIRLGVLTKLNVHWEFVVDGSMVEDFNGDK